MQAPTTRFVQITALLLYPDQFLMPEAVFGQREVQEHLEIHSLYSQPIRQAMPILLPALLQSPFRVQAMEDVLQQQMT